MSDSKKCPVCGESLPAPIPDFCMICGWNCYDDITLNYFLTSPTRRQKETYDLRLKNARERWSNFLEQKERITNLEMKLTDLEREKTEQAVEFRKMMSYSNLTHVEGGLFKMGSECGGYDEKPVHSESVGSFWIAKHPVIQTEWSEIMQGNPSFFRGPNRPVECISWYDAVVFCNKLSAREGFKACYSLGGSDDPSGWSEEQLGGVTCDFSSNGFRLPTEKEWEFAARGGNKSTGTCYSGSKDLTQAGWFENNSGEETKAVGLKSPNELALYDLSGNVWEWCWDIYGSYASKDKQRNGPAEMPAARIARGGSWKSGISCCTVSYRGNGLPHLPHNHVGFRLIRSSVETK